MKNPIIHRELHAFACKLVVKAAFLLPLLTASPLHSAAVNVRLVGLSTSYSSHDISAIATQLNGMLAATPGYSGSSAAATVFSGRSLTEAYYYPAYRDATRAAVAGDYDYLVILPETTWLYNYPEMTFDGVLQMSRKALAVGTTPLLLMPGTGTSAYINTLGTNSYRIGNGCGIHVIPGGYAAQSANQLSMTTNQAYLLAATIFTKITGLNAASGTSYVPASVSNYSSLAGTAVTTTNTHNTTVHYTTSRENSGLVRYRNITPANNSLRYVHTGSSTERGISSALTPILQASGYSVSVYYPSSTWGWTNDMATTAATNFATYPGQYTLGYFRSPFIAAASSTLTDPNQPNLLPIAYDQQYTGMSNTGTLEDFYSLTEEARGQCVAYGFSTVPIHLGAARLNDVDPSLAFSSDGTHWNPPFYNMIAAMMATTSLGREPTPPAAVLADSNLLNGFKVGKQLVRQLAFLSQTEAHCPDTSLAITVPPALTAIQNQAFTYNFAATGGTAPYTWTVESTAGLPAGLALSSSGSLSGIATADAGNWQLVIQVKDSTGAIRKIPATLAVALSGSGAGTLAITSGDGLSAYGNAGGPFSPTSQVYTLSNVGTTSINWTAAKSQSWVTLNPASGTLAAGANTTVTVSINSNADALAANTYSDTVTFTNTTNNNGNTTRGVSLTINSLSTNLAWDANGTTAGQTDGAGAWLAANQWWNGTANANWTSSRNASFGNGGAGGAVTLASPTTVNALAFNACTGTYTLGTSGQTLTLNGGITVDAAAGAVSLVSPVSLGFPQTWANHSASTLTASSAISGSGGLTKSGTGTMVLAPDTDSSSYAGATTVAGGVLNIQKSTALGSVTSGTSVSSGATLQIQGGISVGTEALALDGSGVSNTGALRNISGTNFYGGLLTLNGATRIQSDAGTLVLSNTGTISGSGAALTVAGAGHTSIMGNIATGSGSLTKEGNGTLTLYGVSSYSGGTTINGGNISLATAGTDSLGAANSSVAVNVSTTLTANGNTTLQKSFAINNNSTLSFANASSHITVTGAVTGNGGVRPIGGAGSLGQRTTTLSSTSNSFTGPISNPVGSNFADLSFNSLYDGAGAGNITFGESGQSRTMRVQLGSGATGPLTLSNRRIVLVGTTPTANISNNNGTAANAITIQNDLVNSQTGAGTLELGGYNTGNNRFLGNITNGSGGGTLGLTKGGPGVWALSGTNTYSGTTILGFSNPAGGALVFQGMQSLPSGTKLQQTNSGGTGGFSTVKLLDDSATPPSRTGVNLAMLASSSTHNMTLFVGNNSTANGGTSSSSQTGSTIALGNLDFIQNSSGNTSQTLTVNGANGYGLSIQNIDLPSLLANSTTWAGVLNPTSAPLTVSGNVRQKAGSVVGTMTLKLDGTASGNQILGTITDSADAPALALAVSKTNTSIWTLSGTNTYTGTTTITAGKLFINGNQTSASGAVSVAANATLGGTGTIGGSTTIAASGKLEFALSSTAAGHDKLELASGKSLTFSGASTLTITSPGGASPGTYTLITAPGGISGVAPATLNLPAGWAATVSISGTNLLLNVTSTGVVTPGNLEVTGADGLASSGYVGGPFSPGSVAYTLRNTGQTSIDWTAGKTAAWLNLSSASGTLAPNASTTVTVSIHSTADSLAAGDYNDTVSFTNTSNGNGNTTRAVSLNTIALPTYAVTYDGNGNSGGSAPAAQTKTYNLNLTLSGQGTLVRSGYGFTGWNTAADGSGTSYPAGATYTANAAITLYAQWEPLVLAVVTDKGTVSVPEGATSTFRVKLSNPPENTVTVSVSRISGDTDITVQSGASLSFTTSNWSTYQTVTLAAANDADVNDGSAIISCDANDATYLDSQVTAVEADKHTTLTLANDGNGTTTPSGAQVVEKDAATAIAATASEGYDFTNWTVTSGSASIASPTSVSTTVTLSSAATVRANFTLKTYSVTYNGNGNSGGGAPAAQTKNHGENLALATNSGSLTKTGYTFAGWNTAADGSGTNYAEGASYTQNAALALHAKWTPNTYQLTFDPNGGTVADPATKEITYGSAYGPLATTSRTGYSFDGWFTAVSEGTQVDAASLVATAENHTLYAQWTADTYTVTYNGNGNSGGTVPADQSKVHDVNLTLATNSGDLAKSGFTFAGWNTAEDGTGTDYAAGATYSTNAAVTLFAKWEPGADGTWIQTTAGPFNWGDGANWSGGTVASGADRTANFTANITPDQTVTLEAPRTIGGITFTDSTTSSNNLTLSGTNTLTLSRSFDNPVINVTQSGRTLTISCPIAGSNGLQKNGAGKLILSNTANTYTGGTIINGGIMSEIRAGSFGSGPITVAGSSSFEAPYGAYPVLANSITINSGATATFSLATQYYTMTFDGELSGEGTVLVSGANAGATFRNDSNTFTGKLTANSNGITLNSLPDSSNPIQLNGGSLTLGAGTASPLLFDSRRIELTGTTNGGRITNNNATAANSIIINTDLLITGTGNKTLTLSGSNTGDNVFAGNIADAAGSVISLSKLRQSGGTWALSGTNTYSGNTTLGDGSGTLIIRGKQALSPNSTVVLTQSSSSAFYLKLLDDTAGTVSLPNTFGLDTGNSSMGGIIFVGNNHTANGGNSSATTTGSTISLNKVTPWSLGNTKSLHGFKAEGANGYTLGINSLEIPAFSSTTFTSLTGWTMQLTANSAPIAISGTVQQLAGSTSTTLTTRTFEFGGSNGNSRVSGDIKDSADGTPIPWRVSKSGTGTWILSGTNTYTGTTTVNAGKLFINGDSSAATGTISVANGATLGGNGTVGGSVTVASGGKLEFDLSTAAASHNPLNLSSGKDFTFSGTSTLTITCSGVASTGTYTLVTGGNNLIGVAPATLVLPNGWAGTVSIAGNSLVLNLTTVGPGPLDHFAISTIASPQTVGTPITGITLTAQDAANQTVTSFTGTVSFGGTGGFSGTSASFVNGVLSGLSLTPTVAGSDLTLTVSDGAGHDGSATIATIRTPFTAWSDGSSFDTDSNGDGVKDGLAWVLGATNPSGSMQGKLPAATRSNDKLRVTFRCLKSTKRGTAQLHIQTSSDLGVSDPWTNHATPVPDTDQTLNGIVFDTTDDGDYIQVTADIPAAGNKLFSRLMVSE